MCCSDWSSAGGDMALETRVINKWPVTDAKLVVQ